LEKNWKKYSNISKNIGTKTKHQSTVSKVHFINALDIRIKTPHIQPKTYPSNLVFTIPPTFSIRFLSSTQPENMMT